MIDSDPSRRQEGDNGQRPRSDVNLIAGRLGYYYCGGLSGEVIDDRPTSYGIARLGLAVEGSAVETTVSAETILPTSASAAGESDGPFKRGSYKLPIRLLGWLKALATTTKRYQYSIVIDALQMYLAKLTNSLEPAQRAAVAELRQTHNQPSDADDSAKPAGSANSSSESGAPACDEDGAAEYDKEWSPADEFAIERAMNTLM